MNDLLVQAKALHKFYTMGKTHLHVLRGVSFSVERGQFVTIVGASGSGKSTLLHLVGLLDRHDRGQLILENEDVADISAARRNRIRCRDIGFVFQFYHLLPELNVLENTMLPASVDSSVPAWLSRRNQSRVHAMGLLERMGLRERLKHRPSELSGGERQRVAIARALMNKPKLLLADEPTGNLDSRTGQSIMEILKELNSRAGQTILMVTHDVGLTQQAHRVLHLRDGHLSE